jgi:hypothetical protein
VVSWQCAIFSGVLAGLPPSTFVHWRPSLGVVGDKGGRDGWWCSVEVAVWESDRWANPETENQYPILGHGGQYLGVQLFCAMVVRAGREWGREKGMREQSRRGERKGA